VVLHSFSLYCDLGKTNKQTDRHIYKQTDKQRGQTCFNPVIWSRGVGGTQKVLYGEAPPQGPTLTLLHTIFSEKTPISYTFYCKKAPLSYTFLRRLMNKSLKQEVFLSFFFLRSATAISCVCLICFNSRPFLIPEWRFSYPFIYLNLWNLYPFIYLKVEKGTPFGRSLPVEVRGSTLPLGGSGESWQLVVLWSRLLILGSNWQVKHRSKEMLYTPSLTWYLLYCLLCHQWI